MDSKGLWWRYTRDDTIHSWINSSQTTRFFSVCLKSRPYECIRVLCLIYGILGGWSWYVNGFFGGCCFEVNPPKNIPWWYHRFTSSGNRWVIITRLPGAFSIPGVSCDVHPNVFWRRLKLTTSSPKGIWGWVKIEAGTVWFMYAPSNSWGTQCWPITHN